MRSFDRLLGRLDLVWAVGSEQIELRTRIASAPVVELPAGLLVGRHESPTKVLGRRREIETTEFDAVHGAVDLQISHPMGPAAEQDGHPGRQTESQEVVDKRLLLQLPACDARIVHRVDGQDETSTEGRNRGRGMLDLLQSSPKQVLLARGLEQEWTTAPEEPSS